MAHCTPRGFSQQATTEELTVLEAGCACSRGWLTPRLVLGLLLSAAALLPGHALAGDPTYLEELIARASQANLHEDRNWHLLLHYRKNLTGGFTSEADHPGFFLATNGKTDPQAEVEATLAQFFSTELVGRSRQPAQCAFVARY
ncbi:MAG: hypothetical protein ACREIS_10105, partial [Nitrospiraceae bacterium]